jgi:DNA-binding XRE family transcriptional regulator
MASDHGDDTLHDGLMTRGHWPSRAFELDEIQSAGFAIDDPELAPELYAIADAALIRRTLAKNVRRERECAELSRETLAELCLVRRSTISRIENAQQEPRLSTLVAFSRVLKVPLAALTEGLPERQPF